MFEIKLTTVALQFKNFQRNNFIKYNFFKTIFSSIYYLTDNLVVQVDTIFISGMSPDLSEDDIAGHFGAIGVIKVIPKFQMLETCDMHSVLELINNSSSILKYR